LVVKIYLAVFWVSSGIDVCYVYSMYLFDFELTWVFSARI